MFKKECKLLLLIWCATIAISSVSAQKPSSWQMQPVAIQTPWAKLVDTKKTLPDYPRPQMVRSQWQNLNGLWKYAITDSKANPPVQFDGDILVPYPIESALSGVARSLQPDQALWYQRIIAKPVLKTGERVLLHFGSVDWQAIVYVNNKEIGSHSGGYQNFCFDITDALKSGSNEISIKVIDPTDKGLNPHGKQVLKPQGIMYTASSGIWQTVWLETVPVNYIESLKITPDIDKAVLSVEVAVSSTTAVKARISVNVPGCIKCKVMKQIQDNDRINITLRIPNPRLWSPDDPFLYDLQVRLIENGKAVDQVTSYFGMRKIAIQKAADGFDRIFLNNKYLYNLGTLDQGFWPEGLYTAPTDEALLYDIKAAKAMGFNTIRKHIKVEPSRWYYHCDKLGMLVWQDMVNPGNDTKEGQEQFEKECGETIAQNYNHPCIVTWVLFNEKWGQFDQARLAQWMKQKDSTRLINSHSGEMLFVNDQLRSPSPDAWINSDMTDVHAYPMPGHIQFQKGKAAVLGEFGGIGVPIEGHIWDDLVAGWGYDGIVTPNKMKMQYNQMVDSLKVLERKGLSASIYTQPFDVEAEQNGLITYDRKIIKLPVSEINRLNKKVWPSTLNIHSATKGFHAIVADTSNQSYLSKLELYKSGRRDSALLRSLVIMAYAQRDKLTGGQAFNDYLKTITNRFQKSNIRFIQRFTRSTSDSGFVFLYNNIDRANSILGKDEVESRLIGVIEADYINPYTEKNANPDWDAIFKNVTAKFYNLGKEAVLQSQFIYALNNKNLILFKKTSGAWFENYGSKRSFVGANLLNSAAWTIFEMSDDPEVLSIALEMSKRSVDLNSDLTNLDTYANLLYKLGRKDEALSWEKKALLLAPDHKELLKNYEKMQNNIPTWK